MTLTIYGIARSRTIRTLWLAQELGLEYRHVEVAFDEKGTKGGEFAKINPNGKVPVIDDDGLVMWESLAINLYLAKKHGGPLAPANLAEDGQMTMWALWSAGEIEANAGVILHHSYTFPPEQRRPDKVVEAKEKIVKPLGVLEAHLAREKFLVGGRFTTADLNLACCLFYLRMSPEVLAPFPAVRAYYEAAFSRPAARTAMAMRGE
jgi:glutathione S-transferase